MKFKLVIPLVLISLISVVDTVKAGGCGNDGAIGSIQFQACNKIAFMVGGDRPSLSTEEFTTMSISQTAVVVAKHNVVINEIIAKALVEKDQGTSALTILAYKIPDSMTRSLPTAISVQWIASR